MINLQDLNEIVSDPFDGPYEGVDFSVDAEGYIQVEDPKTAAIIMRKANASGLFSHRLVKLARKGDHVILGFDLVADSDPVHTAQIGYQRAVRAEVKADDQNRFYVYLDGKRLSKIYNKLSAAKGWIKKHDKELCSLGETVATYEDTEF